MLGPDEDKRRTRRFYESSPAGRRDGAVKEKTTLDTAVRELHYQLAF